MSKTAGTEVRMKAMQLVGFGRPFALELREVPVPEPGTGEVRVGLRAAAVNRRDVWVCLLEDYCALPVTLGSDGAGVVTAVGDGVTDVRVGDEVVINPTLNWGDSEVWPGPDFDILGAPLDGTFAEQVVVGAANVGPRPAHLEWREAGAIGLGGLTAWRAVATCAKARPGMTILVTGAGGGVSAFAVQIAVGLGARVFVTSSSAEKLDRALVLGAADGFLYTDPGWTEALLRACEGGVDAVVDSSGGVTWDPALKVLRQGGVLVSYGDTTPEPAVVEVADVYWNWRSIVGTSMGSPREFSAYLDFVQRVRLRPTIDAAYPLAQADLALERLGEAERFGKVVISIA
jgi:zinc-binding alcohol dehydrogenase/oxidoreductase